MTHVSVIVPCYNYGRFLPGCVQSVLGQPGVDLSLLIIDDASSDDSWRVAMRLAEADQRVTVQRHLANRGHIPTYNEGLTWADGDYTVLISPDDRLVSGALSRTTALLDAHPEVGLVYGRSIVFASDDAMPEPRVGRGRWKIWPGRKWLESRCRLGRTNIASPEAIVRTSLQHRLGGYREDLPETGDNEMWMRFALHSDVGCVWDADQAYYRIHGASMSAVRFNSPLIDLQERKKAFDVLFLEHAGDLPDRHRLHLLARRSLAQDALWQASRALDQRTLDRLSVDDMVEFALSVDPDARRLAEYRGLEWRRRLGPRYAHFAQPLIAPVLIERRARRLWWEHGPHWWRHWRRQQWTWPAPAPSNNPTPGD